MQRKINTNIIKTLKICRLDGRRANELRRIRYKLGVFTQPDGSAYLEQGNTKVLVAVYGPHKVNYYHLLWIKIKEVKNY